MALADPADLPRDGTGTSPVFAGSGLPREMISLAVRRYPRHGRSSRDAGKLLAERGITVDHITIHRRGAARHPPEFIEAARPCRRAPGSRRFAGETHLKIARQ